MTATMPVQQQKAYRGVVYGIDILDHFTRLIADDDYVGKTRQRGRGRENQHRDDKPWSDLIVGSSHVLWEGICTEDELDEIERRFIREKAPRMNDRDNRWNLDRISFGEQVRQRHERDDAAGRPRWVPLEQRVRASLLEWETTPLAQRAVQVQPRRQWKPWQKKLVAWLSGWLIATFTGWAGLVHWFDLTPWWTPPTISGSATGLVVLWLLAGTPLPKRRKRRKRRRG